MAPPEMFALSNNHGEMLPKTGIRHVPQVWRSQPVCAQAADTEACVSYHGHHQPEAGLAVPPFIGHNFK